MLEAPELAQALQKGCPRRTELAAGGPGRTPSPPAGVASHCQRGRGRTPPLHRGSPETPLLAGARDSALGPRGLPGRLPTSTVGGDRPASGARVSYPSSAVCSGHCTSGSQFPDRGGSSLCISPAPSAERGPGRPQPLTSAGALPSCVLEAPTREDAPSPQPVLGTEIRQPLGLGLATALYNLIKNKPNQKKYNIIYIYIHVICIYVTQCDPSTQGINSGTKKKNSQIL